MAFLLGLFGVSTGINEIDKGLGLRLFNDDDGHGYKRINFSDNYHKGSFDFLNNSGFLNDRESHNLILNIGKLDKGMWSWAISHCRDFADHASHDCGLGRNNQSLDTHTVLALEHVNEDSIIIYENALEFYNKYFSNNYITKQKEKITNKIQIYTNLASIIQSDFDKIIADNSANILILENIKSDSNTNNKILKDNSNFLDSNLSLNEEYSKYLEYSKNKPRVTSINNYEELYKGIIIQNEIIQKTLDKVNNDILSYDKKSGFISENKSFIYSVYLKIFLFYYILVIVFIIFLIFIQKEWIYYKIIIAIITIIYPPIIFYLETFLYNIWNYIFSISSSSVFTYTDLFS